MKQIREALSFDDVSICDGYSNLRSRSDLRLSQMLRERRLNFPVALAPMESICSLRMAHAVLRQGGMYIQHRYCSVDERLDFANEIYDYCLDDEGLVESLFANNPILGVAVGLTEDDESISLLIQHYDLICLDVAALSNSRCVDRIEQLIRLIEEVDPIVQLMVGNFSGSYDLICQLFNRNLLLKIDYLKVSQGGGSVCSTRVNTGIGVPTFQAVFDLKRHLDKWAAPEHQPLIVADGGIKNTGDIVKALGAGASVVMCGGLFAGHYECPGEIVVRGTTEYKNYRGMASQDSKELYDMSVEHIEGVSSLVPLRGSVYQTLERMEENIQSGIATAGFESVEDFVGCAEFVRVTPAGHYEGTPHVQGKITQH